LASIGAPRRSVAFSLVFERLIGMAGSMPERASIGALNDGGVARRSVVHLDRTDGAYAFLDDWSERFAPGGTGLGDGRS
jgi:hypothetical protein